MRRYSESVKADVSRVMTNAELETRPPRWADESIEGPHPSIYVNMVFR